MQTAIIGGGKMGTAIARGLQSFGAPVVIIQPSGSRSDQLDSIGFDTAPALHQVDTSDVVLAVKPAKVDEACEAISRPVRLLSVVAGVTTARLLKLLPDGSSVIRAMPNLGATVGKSFTAISRSSNPDDLAWATSLMSSVGACSVVDEQDIDAVTAVAGSGPAYFFDFTQQLASAGEAAGLKPEVAREAARATLIGAAALVDNDERELTELINDVATPGGTTEAALSKLSSAIPQPLEEAVAAAKARAQELGSN